MPQATHLKAPHPARRDTLAVRGDASPSCRDFIRDVVCTFPESRIAPPLDFCVSDLDLLPFGACTLSFSLQLNGSTRRLSLQNGRWVDLEPERGRRAVDKR